MIEIYHNPRCSKSRETLNLLQDKGLEVKVIEYLKEVPTFDQIQEVLNMLGIPAEKLIRRSEPIFKEKYKGKSLTEDQWIKAMVEHPKLIERPIVISNGKAKIGRPPQQVLEIV